MEWSSGDGARARLRRFHSSKERKPSSAVGLSEIADCTGLAEDSMASGGGDEAGSVESGTVELVVLGDAVEEFERGKVVSNPAETVDDSMLSTSPRDG